jgi:DNA-binding transcriptional LysR family regulator
VKDHGQLSGESDLRLLQALAFGDPHGPGLQGGPFDHATHHDVCCLVEGTSDHLVADLADVPGAIDLAGLMLARCQAQMSADGFGSEEPGRHVDAGSVSQSDQCAHARNVRQAATDGIALNHPDDHAVEPVIRGQTSRQSRRSCDVTMHGNGRAVRARGQWSPELDSNDVIVDAGLAGTGLVQLHTYMAEPHLRSGQLVQVLTDYAAMGPPISVLFPSNRHLAPKVRVFIDFVADILRRDEENGLVDVPDWPLAANVA